MNFLFGLRFNLFDVFSIVITTIFIDATDSYWWYLLLVPAMWVSVVMERKLEVNKFLERHGIK